MIAPRIRSELSKLGDFADVSATAPPSFCLGLSLLCCAGTSCMSLTCSTPRGFPMRKCLNLMEGEGEEGKDGERSGSQLDRSVNSPSSKRRGGNGRRKFARCEKRVEMRGRGGKRKKNKTFSRAAPSTILLRSFSCMGVWD